MAVDYLTAKQRASLWQWTISRLNREHPYGSGVVIQVSTFMVITFFFWLFFWHLQKMECVGHIQKRLGEKTAWPEEEDLCRWQRSSAESEVGREGTVDWFCVDSLTVYFGEAIRNFPGDVDGMFRVIWAVFHHSISDDDQHDHQFCPSGSWCKFNRALADNVEPPKHTPKLPKDLGPFIKPVFTELSKRELLERCVLGATQNQNESFNSIIWSRCPKTLFCSLVSVDIAVNLAMITFNHGLEGLSPLFVHLLGSPPSSFTANCT